MHWQFNPFSAEILKRKIKPNKTNTCFPLKKTIRYYRLEKLQLSTTDKKIIYSDKKPMIIFITQNNDYQGIASSIKINNYNQMKRP
jgi:hypothetical protein